MENTDDRGPASRLMRYEMEHQGTELGTGWFAAMPSENLEFEVALEYIHDHPNDEFMHRYLLNLASGFGPNLTKMLIGRGKGEDPHLLALMYEACLLNGRLHPLLAEFDGVEIKALAARTPLIYVNWSLMSTDDRRSAWLRRFSENIQRHKLPEPASGLMLPRSVNEEQIRAWQDKVAPIEGVSGKRSAVRDSAPAETARKAREGLEKVGCLAGPEGIMAGSLSPHGLQVQWHLNVSAETDAAQWQLTGLQTSYGKGLTAEEARASCFMEAAERYSSFARFKDRRVLNYARGYVLERGSYTEMAGRGEEVLSPNDMPLEVPYENQALYWILGERIHAEGKRPIYVPAQLVFLFCNLDEISLTSGMPSTGLASGKTLEEAKLSALLEVIERDGERVMPYVSERCFLLEPQGAPIGALLEHAAAKGVTVQFLDITSEFGIPCYKGFIAGPSGEILKGTGAHLDARRAVASALTEVPFHASWLRPSPAPEGLKILRYDQLPSYSSGEAPQDLDMLEKLLVANGYGPIYVDLTRQDLGIPAVKALVPGLEIFAEFDRFSSLSLRQFCHYFEAFGTGGRG